MIYIVTHCISFLHHIFYFWVDNCYPKWEALQTSFNIKHVFSYIETNKPGQMFGHIEYLCDINLKLQVHPITNSSDFYSLDIKCVVKSFETI